MPFTHFFFQLPGSNALETKAAVVRAMEALKQRFPAGLDYRVVYDTTVALRPWWKQARCGCGPSS